MKLGLELNCQNCDLSYNLFPQVDLSNSKFSDCKVVESDFTGAIARRVQFENCDLLKTIFDHTDLRDADFCTARNYFFDPSKNLCKGAKFSAPEALNLLQAFGITVE